MESDFQKTESFGPVTKFQKTVKTPQPANPDGSGYTTEENRMVIYTIGDYQVKVCKVSTRGWSVKRYHRVDGLDKMDMDYHSEDEAHTIAREMVEEVAE